MLLFTVKVVIPPSFCRRVISLAAGFGGCQTIGRWINKWHDKFSQVPSRIIGPDTFALVLEYRIDKDLGQGRQRTNGLARSNMSGSWQLVATGETASGAPAGWGGPLPMKHSELQ